MNIDYSVIDTNSTTQSVRNSGFLSHLEPQLCYDDSDDEEETINNSGKDEPTNSGEVSGEDSGGKDKPTNSKDSGDDCSEDSCGDDCNQDSSRFAINHWRRQLQLPYLQSYSIDRTYIHGVLVHRKYVSLVQVCSRDSVLRCAILIISVAWCVVSRARNHKLMFENCVKSLWVVK